ncbi:MAG TPA: carboxymuconolactone decarboxylase family protein [Steroidobacteraceae bacterium]|jgi:AhpD family alkylhydroperoxidase|nr:carboxymuconolactone decarboxylase family protein [Steroidobacteraceae bacterium]
MQARIDFMKVSPAAIKTLLDMEAYLARSSIERPLLHLVKMRASQINGCAYCLDMHSKDARNEGETEQRLYALDAWRETPFYSARERAALAWTETLTLVAQTRAPDAEFEAAHAQFSESELVDLSLAIAAINGWNRMCVGFRADVGGYRPAATARMPHATAH